VPSGLHAELGRLDCRKDFVYGREWNGKVYANKQGASSSMSREK
jgi:hypothetical protein